MQAVQRVVKTAKVVSRSGIDSSKGERASALVDQIEERAFNIADLIAKVDSANYQQDDQGQAEYDRKSKTDAFGFLIQVFRDLISLSRIVLNAPSEGFLIFFKISS